MFLPTTGIPCLSKVHFTALHFYERPALVQAYLRNVVGLVLEHHSKANYMNLSSPSAYAHTHCGLLSV